MRFIFFVVIMCSMLSGCSLGIKGHIWNNISEIVDFVVCGQNDNMKLNLMCGRREIEYSSDGVSTELVPYGIITVYLVDDELEVDNISYVLYVGVNKFEGKMEKNPYDNSWVADIKKVVDKSENISIDVNINGEKNSAKLVSIDEDWEVSTNNIINKILIKEYKTTLKLFVKNGEFQGEVYVKLINDYDKYTSRFYYYVSVQGRDNSYLSILVSPKTGEILASNTSV